MAYICHFCLTLEDAMNTSEDKEPAWTGTLSQPSQESVCYLFSDNTSEFTHLGQPQGFAPGMDVEWNGSQTNSKRSLFLVLQLVRSAPGVQNQ